MKSKPTKVNSLKQDNLKGQLSFNFPTRSKTRPSANGSLKSDNVKVIDIKDYHKKVIFSNIIKNSPSF